MVAVPYPAPVHTRATAGPEDPPPNSLQPKRRSSRAPGLQKPPSHHCTRLPLHGRNLAALGQKDVLSSRLHLRSQESLTSDLPLGTLTHMDDLPHTRQPQWNKLTFPVLQAKQRFTLAGPGAVGLVLFPAATGKMSSLEGSAGLFSRGPRAAAGPAAGGGDVRRSRGAGQPHMPSWQQRTWHTPSDSRNEYGMIGMKYLWLGSKGLLFFFFFLALL